MRILHTLRLEKLALVPVVPKIVKLVNSFLVAISDNKLTMTEATDLVEDCLLPILNKIGVKLPVFVLDILPELLVKIQKSTVLMMMESNESKGVV
jgi:hypothetical protein